LLTHEGFERGVQLLMKESFSTGDLLNYAAGTNTVICCLSFESLARRTSEPISEEIVEQMLNMFGGMGYWPLYFAFRALKQYTTRPVIGPVMTRVNLGWRSPVATQILREFIEERVSAGETPALGDELNRLQEEEAAENLENTLREIGEPL